MTWPTTPVATTNLDAGSDQPRLARADLKQMADNVNDIQATFDINGAADGDLMIYNSATSKWEYADGSTYIAANSTPANIQAAIQVSSGTVGPGISGRQTLPITELYDPNGLISISSNTFTLGAGTYLIESYGGVHQGGNRLPLELFNDTDNSLTYSLNSSFASTPSGVAVNIITWSNVNKLTLTGTKTFRLTFVSSSISDVFYYGGYNSGQPNTVTPPQQLLITKLP